MRRHWFIISLTLLLLWVLVGQVNHYLTVWRVFLFVGGLYVTYSALLLPLRPGLAATLLAGLLCDANSPVTLGTHTLLFAAAHAVLFHVRDRVPREETITRVVLALLANLALFLVVSFLLIGHSPAPGAVWPRIIFDLVCSQVFLALIAPWFFALQTRSLELAGLRTRGLH